MRILIYGAGAMGTVLGAFLSAGGVRADLVTRNISHVEALRERGARIVGGADFTAPVNAFTPQDMSGEYDVIFLMTKQRDNPGTLAYLKGYLSADGVVCTLQNGLPEDSVAAVVGKDRCLGCAVSWGAEIRESGVAALTSERKKMSFALGSPYGANARIDGVAEILQRAGRVEKSDNFLGARWAKLAVNSAFSSISAITGLNFYEVASKRPYNGLALKMLNEAFAAAEAGGVTIAPIQGHDIVKIYRCSGGLKRAFSTALLPLAMRGHRNIVSGMCRDLLAGRKCDIDFVNGAVARAGAEYGVPTPLNDKVIEIAHAIEDGGLQVCAENAYLLKNTAF